MREQDIETRARLLNEGARLFAARGFKDVTVRMICSAAGANVASVNYHFGDKLGLYREVLNTAIETMQATTEAARKAGQGGTPEEKLRAYIRVFLQRFVGGTRCESWIQQLMAREMAESTAALDVVAERVIRPRLEYVAEIVADMLHRRRDDQDVLRCVLSIQGQCHAAMPNPISKRLFPDFSLDAEALDRLTNHIVQFSLAGIRAVSARKVRDVRKMHKVRKVQTAHRDGKAHGVR